MLISPNFNQGVEAARPLNGWYHTLSTDAPFLLDCNGLLPIPGHVNGVSRMHRRGSGVSRSHRRDSSVRRFGAKDAQPMLKLTGNQAILRKISIMDQIIEPRHVITNNVAF